MANNIVFGIEFDTKTGQAQLKNFEKGFQGVSSNLNKMNKEAKTSFAQSIEGIERFSNLMSNLKGAFNNVFSMFSEAISLSNQYETALTGLAKTAENFAQSQSDAKKAAIELSKDGLVNVTANATSLKFLMQSGFDLAQALNITTAAKDMGAFGRTTLDFNQAMIDFARGVKTGSLELTENIGFTQRFSAIMKQANVDISNGIDLRNNLAQREAFYNAVLKEGELNKGNAQKYLETTAGSMAAMGTQINILKKEMGDFVKIIVAEILPNVKSLVSWLKDHLAVVVAGLAATITTVLVPALYSFATGLSLATGGVSVLTGAIAALIAYKFSDEMIKNAKATKQAADEAQAYADAVKNLTNEQIRAQIIQKSGEIALQEKRNNELYAERVIQLKELEKLEKVRAWGLNAKREEANQTKFLIDQNNIVRSQNRDQLKILQDQLRVNLNTNPVKEKDIALTEKQIKEQEKLNQASLKFLQDRRSEQTQIDIETEEKEQELQDKKDQKTIDTYTKNLEKKYKNSQDIIQISEDQMDAEMQAWLSGKTEQQIMEDQWIAEQTEKKRQAAEQWAQNNQLAADIITSSYQNITSGLATFIQAGISGGNALKSAWESFKNSILSMISQIIAKAIIMQGILALGNLIGGGVGGFLVNLVGGNKSVLSSGGKIGDLVPTGNTFTSTGLSNNSSMISNASSMVNLSKISIPSSPAAVQLANGFSAQNTVSGGSSGNNIAMAMISELNNTVNALTKQIERFKQTDERTVFTMAANGQKEVMAVV